MGDARCGGSGVNGRSECVQGFQSLESARHASVGGVNHMLLMHVRSHKYTPCSRSVWGEMQCLGQSHVALIATFRNDLNQRVSPRKLLLPKILKMQVVSVKN